MKNFWKYIGFSVLGLLVFLYLSFLFILPNIIDINKFKPDIQKIAKETANVSIDFENAKIITTPLLGVGVKIDGIKVNLPDNSLLFSADSFKTRVALPSIFVWTVKISCVEINNPFINLEIANENELKLIELVEDILNKGREQNLEENGAQEVEETFITNTISKIRIKVPYITINNYKILVNDLKSKHYLKLTGEQLKAGYFNGKTVKVKTYAELFSDENKNITANIDINTFLPPAEPQLDKEDDPAERIDIPFVNPVTIYRNYDLKTSVDAKLKIRGKNNNIKTYGHLNVDNLTLKIAHIVLPESYLHAKFHKQNVVLDTNIFVTQKDSINLNGKLNYSKHPKTDIKIKTTEIQFNDIMSVAKALLSTLQIPNELDKYAVTGSIKSDCYVKTNFKKLKSNGSMIIKNGGITVTQIGRVLRDANINIILDNNTLDIQNSKLFISNSPVFINGKIDEKSVTNIDINAQNIPLAMIFNAFAPNEIRNAYDFRSGNITLIAKVNGKMKKAVSTLKANLNNLYLADKNHTFVIQNKSFSSEFFTDTKKLIGKILNEGLVVSLPPTKSTISAPKFETEIADNNISILENKLNINNKTSITYSGAIVNYNKPKSINFIAEGNLATDDLIQIIGKELKPFIHSNGALPLKVTFDGNNKKQTLFAQILADRNNFITPVDILNVQGKNTTLQTVVDFKGNRIKIKKTGFFIRNITVDKKGNETISLEEILGIDGTIAGNTINLIKITMPHTLTGKLFVFSKSNFFISGRAFVFGQTTSPRIRGGFSLNNLSIPEILTEIKNANIRFRGHNLEFNVSDLLLNDSDINIKGNMSLVPASILNVNSLDVSSKYFNLDKVMAVVDKSMKYVPQSSRASTQTSQPADIPVAIHSGSINFARIITGKIDVRNTTAKISMAKNVFYINNLRTNVFDGNAHGNISMNLISSLLKINMSGSHIDVDKALVDAANMKGTLSGTTKFNADISLKGATYEEQMKSLTGKVDFDIVDGQFGPFGKLENMILAENIRESSFFQTALGGIIERLVTIDTTHFSELTGAITFNNGVCHIDPITSLGNVLSLHVFGNFNLLKNYADLKVRARIAGILSNLLGPINAINPVNLMNNAASMNVVTAKAFSLFCEVVPESELNVLPNVTNKYSNAGATKFQIVVNGDVAKPLTLVKSFKWLSSQKEFQAAEDFITSIPEPIEGSTATTIEEIIAERSAFEAEKNTAGYKLKSAISKDWAEESAAKEALKEVQKTK